MVRTEIISYFFMQFSQTFFLNYYKLTLFLLLHFSASFYCWVHFSASYAAFFSSSSQSMESNGFGARATHLFIFSKIAFLLFTLKWAFSVFSENPKSW